MLFGAVMRRFPYPERDVLPRADRSTSSRSFKLGGRGDSPGSFPDKRRPGQPQRSPEGMRVVHLPRVVTRGLDLRSGEEQGRGSGAWGFSGEDLRLRSLAEAWDMGIEVNLLYSRRGRISSRRFAGDGVLFPAPVDGCFCCVPSMYTVRIHEIKREKVLYYTFLHLR